MAAMQHVCVWTAAGESLLLPPTWVLFFFFPPRLLFEESEPNRYSRGRRGGFGERRARQQMERMDGEKASLELHVLSRDLPWRALQEQKKQQNTVN